MLADVASTLFILIILAELPTFPAFGVALGFEATSALRSQARRPRSLFRTSVSHSFLCSSRARSTPACLPLTEWLISTGVEVSGRRTHHRTRPSSHFPSSGAS